MIKSLADMMLKRRKSADAGLDREPAAESTDDDDGLLIQPTIGTKVSGRVNDVEEKQPQVEDKKPKTYSYTDLGAPFNPPG